MRTLVRLLAGSVAVVSALGAVVPAVAEEGQPAFLTVMNGTKSAVAISVDGKTYEVPRDDRSDEIPLTPGLHRIRGPKISEERTFGPGERWRLHVLEGGRKKWTLRERTSSGPSIELYPATNKADRLSVWINNVLAATIPVGGGHVSIAKTVAPNVPIVVELRRGDQSIVKATAPPAAPDATYAVDIVPVNDGLALRISVESAGVGGPIVGPIHTDFGPDAITTAIRVFGISGSARALSWSAVPGPKSISIPAMRLFDRDVVGWNDLAALGDPTPGVGLPHDLVGWWTTSPPPGQIGISLLLGHVSRKGARPSVFGELENLKAGDLISVDGEDGVSRRFVVDRNIDAMKTALPPETWRPVSRAELRIISCKKVPGEFINGHYLRNQIVFAHLVRG